MIKAIIFDMDGVLIDSEKLKAEAWEKILKDYGINNGNEWYKNNLGISRINIAKKAIKDFSLPATAEELAEKKISTYSKLAKEKTEPPIASAMNFLKSIPKKEFKIGLASSTNREIIEERLRKFDILDYFDVIISGEDEVKHNKPHPEMYLITAEKLGVKPEECVAIEDSNPGVEAVKNAGMMCIAVPNEYTREQDFSKADMVVDGLSIQQIQELNRKE